MYYNEQSMWSSLVSQTTEAMNIDTYVVCYGLDQGSSNLSLKGQSAAEISSNPDQTHLPVIF